MADIGNQLEGVGEGLDRFLEALDEAGYKLGSTPTRNTRVYGGI